MMNSTEEEEIGFIGNGNGENGMSGFEIEEGGPRRRGKRRGRALERAMRYAAEADGESCYICVARWCMVAILVLAGVVGTVHVLTHSEEINVLEYSCPSGDHLKVAENFDKESFDKEYGDDTKMIKSNLTEFLDNFRSADFDAWGHSYDEVKGGMRSWKEKYFPPNIKSGESIYESACGVGLNLYMTLEILHERHIDELVVYGNEYLDRSTEKANVVFDNAPPFGATKGRICTGDSSEISFVPSNAFDLVYTGYIRYGIDTTICVG